MTAPQHTKNEAVKILRISLKTIEREIQAGRLGCVRIGRRVYFTDDQLAAYISAHTIDADAAV
jgi:excisionase family DNA binding protein